MKIAIPVDEHSRDTKVCISFGRTPYFLIYDIDNNEEVFIENTAASSQGGAGIKAAQLVVDNAVDALITPRCGENAANVFIAANIKLYKTINDCVNDNIEAFKCGKLTALDNIHPGFHGHGG